MAELAPVVLPEVDYFEAVAKLSCSIVEPLMSHPLASSSSVEILSPSYQINELERALKREAIDDRNRASIQRVEQSLRPLATPFNGDLQGERKGQIGESAGSKPKQPKSPNSKFRQVKKLTQPRHR